MLVLLMASTLRDQLPAIVFEQPNELAELHAARPRIVEAVAPR
jgi:hypothetical protein